VTTFDDTRLEWRKIPLRDVLPPGEVRYHLGRAGYTTLGDLLNATEEELAANVYSVGPIRARNLRRSALAAAKAATPQAPPAGEDLVAPDWPGSIEIRWFGPEMLVAVVALAGVFLIGLSLGFGLLRL
jgi:hypothetical protein